MTEQSLAEELHLWFERHKRDKNKWRTPVGRLIKAELKLAGNWKNKKRGRANTQNLVRQSHSL